MARFPERTSNFLMGGGPDSSPPTHQNHPPVNQRSSTVPESLSGLIERVTFFNEGNGFGVLRVKAKGHRDLVAEVGSLPSASAGEWVTAEGRWVQDKEFGLQFRAATLNSTAPTTREGIEKYLGRGADPAAGDSLRFSPRNRGLGRWRQLRLG